ncbi:M43 family zinc metalloprotease [Chryseobacterium sp. 09-1422]|uniref:M43 family zinc metalloprotease n=1 Tax=Chryseobacterium kimseyorum TaxID=2984028 RepID=A0ABT3HY42_9FLAO|nr:M43 family zinc metalloprotease [Chryseobacterium kimseyorum]MCW3168721.1 M43 family zinc metalloprotease [Chryseobacterium kimseyorum]
MRNFTIVKILCLALFSFAGLANAQTTTTSGAKENQKTDKPKKDLSKSNGFERCSFTEYENYLQRNFPGRATTAEFEAWIKPLIEEAKQNKSQNGGIVTIPVVVHVIHSGQNVGSAPNISDAQVQSQITVMNNDFRRLAGTPGFNSNVLGADTMIQFALAKVDPNGNPTDGIDRVNLCLDRWTTAQINNTVKPQTIWDPTRYMNMWSVYFSDGSLLGYAQFPDTTLPGLNPVGGLASTDGVVANFSTFGSKDYDTNNSFFLAAPYNKGRTMTHEVGHFLGLRHIWGDGYDANGNPTLTICETDYCNDTPPAHDANYACNPNVASCTQGLFEMVQNYMDYTPDACMNIYTIDQKSRITTVMNNSPRRMDLKTSVADIAIPLFANDAEVKVERGCTSGNCSNVVKFLLYNRGTANLTSANISYTIGTSGAQTYAWTGSLAQNKYAVITVPVPNNTANSAAITANVTSANGGTDQRASNNSATGTYILPPAATYYATNTIAFNLQLDGYGSEIIWSLKNGSGQIVKAGGPYQDATVALPPVISENWVLPNDCYTFTITDSYGDGLDSTDGGYVDLASSTGQVIYHGESDILGYGSKTFTTQFLSTEDVVKTKSFGIYPNPATDVLNITKVSDKAKFEIHNAVGQLVKSGTINGNQVRVAELVKGTYIITIQDKNISESIKFIKK